MRLPLPIAIMLAAFAAACGAVGRPPFPSAPSAGAEGGEMKPLPGQGDSSAADEGGAGEPTIPRPPAPALKGSVLDPQHAFAPGTEERLSSLSRRFPVIAQAEIAVLPDAQSFLAARVRAIRGAQRSVRLQTFLYQGDEIGVLFKDELCTAARRGVDVRVLVDDKANIQRASQRLFEELRGCGAKLEGYEPTFFRIFDLLFGREGALSSFELFNMRAHDKILVVDGEDQGRAIGFAGGTNIGNEFFQIADDAKMKWRDQDIAARGALAVSMGKVFDQSYEDHMRLRSDPQSAKKDSFWNVVFAHRGDSYEARDGAELPSAGVGDYGLRQNLMALAKARANASVELDWQRALGGRILQSRPRQAEAFIHHAYLDLFRAAKREIAIFNAYFIPTSEIQEALLHAVSRGVRVRIATNGPSASDTPIVQTAGRSVFQDLMQLNESAPGKLEIYEWRADPVMKNGLGTHHAKYAVVDGEVLVVGSYNLDPRSQFLNSETVVVAFQPRLAAQLLALFAQDTAPRNAVAIDAREADRFQEPKGFLDKLRLDFANRFRAFLYR